MDNVIILVTIVLSGGVGLALGAIGGFSLGRK